MEEEILLTQHKLGTEITYFSSYLSLDTPIGNPEKYCAVLFLDIYGNPTNIKTFDGKELWQLNSENNNVYYDLNSLPNVITGVTYKEEYGRVLNDSAKENLRKTFFSQIGILSSGLTNNTFCLINDKEIADLYVNIKLERTYDILNTLSIKNTTTDEFPLQESDTGVVFGRLEAIQKIKDEAGNFIRIPLRFVPIGIFNTSEKFPDISSLDENNDRIRLNLKTTDDNLNVSFPRPEFYFNQQTFNTDTEYLQETGYAYQVPDEYKFVTTTNENGEFIIYNVPTSNQTLMFEVDLLKQGLTHDEVALNFFPYAASTEVNVDNIPHYFFRQIPIAVTPSWGDFQTGYTEVNISVNLDLRKWTTHFIPPISYFGLSIPQRLASDNTPMTIAVRDMTKIFNEKGQPNTDNLPLIEIAEVTEIGDRVQNQYLEWFNEMLQRKNKILYRGDTILSFKLPANIYDPTAYRTDMSGNPITNKYNKGVWLSAYQFKTYYKDQAKYFRSTGQNHLWVNDGFITRDHFDLNGNIPIENNTDPTNTNEETKYHGLYTFPYEKNWSANYPEHYSIPHVPTKINPAWETSPYLEEPKYLDGDLIGESLPDNNQYHPFPFEAGGQSTFFYRGKWLLEEFVIFVTKKQLYKYDSYDWDDRYASGYRPYINTPLIINTSQVENAEKYQRLECGYGYFIRPDGWPRTSQGIEGELLAYSDILVNQSTNILNVFTPKIFNSQSSQTPQYGIVDTTLDSSYKPKAAIDYDLGFNYVIIPGEVPGTPNENPPKFFIPIDDKSNCKNGALRFYRIIDPSPQTLLAPSTPISPKYVRINFQKMFVLRGLPLDKPQLKLNQTQSAAFEDEFIDIDNVLSLTKDSLKLVITNKGISNTKITINSGVVYDVPPGNPLTLTLQDVGSWDNLILDFTTNDIFTESINENYYDKLNVNIQFTNIRFYEISTNTLYDQIDTLTIFNSSNLQGGNTPINYYIATKFTRGYARISRKCNNTFQNSDCDATINGVAFVSVYKNGASSFVLPTQVSGVYCNSGNIIYFVDNGCACDNNFSNYTNQSC